MHCGYPSARQFLESIEYDEFSDWLRFYRQSPFGPRAEAVQRADIVVAMFAAQGHEVDRDEILLSWGFGEVDGWHDLPDDDQMSQTQSAFDALFG